MVVDQVLQTVTIAAYTSSFVARFFSGNQNMAMELVQLSEIVSDSKELGNSKGESEFSIVMNQN